MKRAQLEHILRASGSITTEREFVVIGSQALLGTLRELPGSLGQSMEADIYPLHRPELADLIDGSIGEGSPFHLEFGYYAQGVGPETASLAADWRSRCSELSSEATAGSVGLCLHAEDIAASKAIAGREKDRVFLDELFSADIVDPEQVIDRIQATEVEAEMIRAAVARVKVACHRD